MYKIVDNDRFIRDVVFTDKCFLSCIIRGKKVVYIYYNNLIDSYLFVLNDKLTLGSIEGYLMRCGEIWTINKKLQMFHLSCGLHDKLKDYNFIVDSPFKVDNYLNGGQTDPCFLGHYDHIEYFDNIVSGIDLNVVEPPNFKEFNNMYTEVFYHIDKHGYTTHNLYNLTSRPSTPLASLPSEERLKLFDKKIICLDFRAYQPTLLCELLGYDGGDNIYEKVARDIGFEVNSDFKKWFIRGLYGESVEGYDHEFFKKVRVYRNDLYTESEYLGVLSLYNKKTINMNTIENARPGKLLSYYMQSMETAKNISILYKFIEKINVYLYLYDSFYIKYEDGIEDFLNENINYKFKTQVYEKKKV